MRSRRPCRLCCLPLLAGPLALAGDAPPFDEGAPLSSLNRLLRKFDFEEAERAPFTMPLKFYRYIAPDQGFPAFGSMHLSRDVAHEGHWSFEFEIGGGSLSARVPTAVLPVLPGSDYTVSAWIRTEGLTHAAARLAARLHDADGRPIPESQVYGPLLRTRGAWQHVSVVVYGDAASAVHLVVELQLLQPRQFIWPARRSDEPLLEDVSGRAWFDDVTILQRPRIELSTSSPGNVVAAQEKIVLNALIRDPTPEPMSARLRIFDLDGTAVHDSTWPLGRGVWTGTMSPRLAAGWYRTVLEVHNGSGAVGSQELDFAVLSDTGRRAGHRLGVVLPSPPDAGAFDPARHLATRLDVGSVLIPVAPKTGTDGRALHRLVEHLLEAGVELTLALPGRPRAFASGTTASATDDLELLGRGPEWRKELGDLLMEYGLDVPRWRLGSPGALERLPPQVLSRLVGGAADGLADFVPEPTILIPWSAEYELPQLPGAHGFWITVPYHVRPQALPEYASRWPADVPTYTTLDRLPPEQFAPQERVIDLMLRALHAWRAGVPRLAITAPWSDRGPRGATVPDPGYPVWRSLAERLEGRSFGGVLPLGEGLHCWILNGRSPEETALAIWKAPAGPSDRPRTMRLLLAADPVEVVDAFGNRRLVPVQDGAHTIELGPRPVFVERADGNLASFRAALEVHPPFVEARQQIHERRLRLRNPWDVTISGTIRLEPPEGWRATPRVHRFVAASGERVELPVDLTFNRGVPTGLANLGAEVELSAHSDLRFRVHLPLETGLPNLEFAAHWRIAGDEPTGQLDLIITQYVTNTGQEPISLNAFVSGPGISRQRRAIGTLEPTQTAVRTFRIADGARVLAGKQVRVGITEQGGTARLNRIMEIPAVAPGTQALVDPAG